MSTGLFSNFSLKLKFYSFLKGFYLTFLSGVIKLWFVVISMQTFDVTKGANLKANMATTALQLSLKAQPLNTCMYWLVSDVICPFNTF